MILREGYLAAASSRPDLRLAIAFLVLMAVAFLLVFAGLPVMYLLGRRAGHRAATDPDRALGGSGYTPADSRTGPFHGPVHRFDPRLSMLALSAAQCERSRSYHDRLDLVPPGAPWRTGHLDRLAHQYDSATRADWQQALMRNETFGLRGELRTLGLLARDTTSEQAVAIARTYGADAALRLRQLHGLRAPQSPLLGLALDISAHVWLCRLGHALGYLSADDAWTRIDHDRLTAQAAFSGWDEFRDHLAADNEYAQGLAGPALDNVLPTVSAAHMPWGQISWPAGTVNAKV